MQNLRSVLYMASGILFGLFLAVLVWVVARNPTGEPVTLRPVPTEKPLIVHITGAVPRPGVYALPEGARVQDAISAAGGFLAEAEKAEINLAVIPDRNWNRRIGWGCLCKIQTKGTVDNSYQQDWVQPAVLISKCIRIIQDEKLGTVSNSLHRHLSDPFQRLHASFSH